MALRVWLPLNKGNIINQGLSSATITGTPSYTSNGKIGAYSLNGETIQIKVPEIEDTKICTFSFWAYITSSLITSNWTRVARFNDKGTNAGSNMRFEVCPSSYSNGIYCFSNHNNTGYGLTTGCITSPTGGYYDQWVHFCFTSDGTVFTRYMNGVKIGTCNYTGKAVLSGDFFLENNDKCFKQDVRVYDHCLSPKEVKEISKGLVAHYKLEGAGANPNLLKNTSSKEIQYTYPTTGTYKDWFSGQTTEIPSASKYTLSFYAKSTVDGDKVRSHYYNPNTTTTCVSSQGVTKTAADGNMDFTLSTKWEKYWVTYTQTKTTAVKNIIFPRMITSGGGTGIVSVKEVKFEEGEKATPWIPNTQEALYNALGYNNIITRDSSGNEHHLSANGTQTYNPDSARYSGSTKMGGTNTDYLRGPMLDFLKSPFTFNCWIYQTSATSTSSGNTGNTLQFIMGQGRDCGYAGFALCSANGYARLYLGSATSGTYWGITDNTINLLNGWHMLTGTFDGANAKLYVDGSLKKTQASTVDPVWTDTGGFVIGKMSYSYTNTGAYFPFVGSVSDARVYATALTADDILTLYKTSGIIDNKGNVYAYEFKEE